jgi:hypothetical protein
LRIPRFVAASLSTLALGAALSVTVAPTASADPDDHCGIGGTTECVGHHHSGGGLLGLNLFTSNNNNWEWQAALDRSRRAHQREQQLQFAYFAALNAQNACGCNPTPTFVIQQRQYFAAQQECGIADRQYFSLRRSY